MDYLLQVVAALVVTAIAIHLLGTGRGRGRGNNKELGPAIAAAKLPPGSMGLPVIGQTLGVLGAIYSDSLDRWVQDRVATYGPVSKGSVCCMPIVLLTGPAANRFVFFSARLRVRTPPAFRRVFGEKGILDLHGDDHRRVRGALLEFLKPDMLKQYIGSIDAKVRRDLDESWHGNTTVTVLPLMRRLTFDIISALLFGLEAGAARDDFAADLVRMAAGIFSVPVNLPPFTTFSRSLQASRRARRLLEGIIKEKKARLARSTASPNSDLFTRLLSLTDDHGQQLLTDEEIVDNGVFALVASHDTTSILMTLMLRHLANHPDILDTMVQEHEEIARNKQADGDEAPLTWEDLSKMKFTWQVAQETLRMDPPIFGNLRTAVEDIEFDGYRIPKGWQVFWAANMTHMDPSIFHEPAKFNPSRFGTHSSVTPPCSFVAFGGGPRVCPGMEFTKMETLVTMHYLVRRFRWKLICCKGNPLARLSSPSPLHSLRIQLEHKTPM